VESAVSEKCPIGVEMKKQLDFSFDLCVDAVLWLA